MSDLLLAQRKVLAPPELLVSILRQERFVRGSMKRTLRIQQERGVALTRSTDPGVDWFDANGSTYDAVGNVSSKYFDRQWPNLQSRILDHMGKADFVPVDVSGFTSEQVAQVQLRGPRK